MNVVWCISWRIGGSAIFSSLILSCLFIQHFTNHIVFNLNLVLYFLSHKISPSLTSSTTHTPISRKGRFLKKIKTLSICFDIPLLLFLISGKAQTSGMTYQFPRYEISPSFNRCVRARVCVCVRVCVCFKYEVYISAN